MSPPSISSRDVHQHCNARPLDIVSVFRLDGLPRTFVRTVAPISNSHALVSTAALGPPACRSSSPEGGCQPSQPASSTTGRRRSDRRFQTIAATVGRPPAPRSRRQLRAKPACVSSPVFASAAGHPRTSARYSSTALLTDSHFGAGLDNIPRFLSSEIYPRRRSVEVPRLP